MKLHPDHRAYSTTQKPAKSAQRSARRQCDRMTPAGSWPSALDATRGALSGGDVRVTFVTSYHVFKTYQLEKQVFNVAHSCDDYERHREQCHTRNQTALASITEETTAFPFLLNQKRIELSSYSIVILATSTGVLVVSARGRTPVGEPGTSVDEV